MKEKQELTLSNKDLKSIGGGYKVIKSEVTIQTETLYAVCTPVKMQ